MYASLHPICCALLVFSLHYHEGLQTDSVEWQRSYDHEVLVWSLCHTNVVSGKDNRLKLFCFLVVCNWGNKGMYSPWGIKNVSSFKQSLRNSVNQEKCLLKPKIVNKETNKKHNCLLLSLCRRKPTRWRRLEPAF